MKDKKDLDVTKLLDLSTWEALIKTDEWKVFVELLKERKMYLEKQVLICVAKEDFHNAVRYEAKAEDITSMLNIVSERMKQLKEARNGEG